MGEFNKVTYLYGWCQKIIPLVYDDSLSYYENLCKVREKLNEVITNTNMIPDMIKQEVQDFINSGQIEDMIEEMLTGYLQRIVVNVVVPPQGITPAKGNGNDDTETFQQCIDYLAENGGGLLFVPDGDWMVKPLTIKNGVYVEGASSYTKITLIGGSSSGLLSGTVTDCGVSNLTLSNNAAQQTVDKAVIDITCNNITLDNLVVKNGYIGVKVTVNNGALIRGIWLDTLGYGGLYVNGNNADVLVSDITVKNVSVVSGQFGVDNACANAVFKRIGIYGPIPTGFSNTGSFVSFDGHIVGCGTGIFNVGDDCDFNAYVTGATTVILDTGEKTDYDFTGQSSQKKIGKQLLNVGTADPIMYKAPTKLNSSFNAIPFQDYDGTSYNVLVEGDLLSSATYVSAKDFGAIGDGITDDTTALQNWLNYLVEGGHMGFIPNGTYLISQLTYRTAGKHFSILGESMDGTILKVSGVLNCLDLRNITGANIGNFTIDMGQSDNSTSGTALYGVDVNDITYHDIVIKNVNYAGTLFYVTDNSNYINNINFNNVQIYGRGTNTDNLHPTGFLLANAYNSHIENCKVKDIHYYAYEYKNYSKYCFVSDCIANNCYQGFYLGGDATPAPEYYTENITLSNFTAINCYQPLWCGMSRNNILSGVNIYVDSEYQFGANAYGFNIRNCENIICNSSLVMWQGSVLAFDLRDNENVSVSASSCIRVSGSGRITNLLNCENCTVKVDWTNDTVARPLSSGTCYYEVSGNVYSFGNGRKRVALTPITEFLTNLGLVNVESAEQLWLQFYSQNGAAERFTYGSATQQIVMDYDHANNRVVLTFEDGTCYIDKDGIHVGSPS